MRNITMVCTRHEELGMCNADELYRLFERLNPDVIFEEIPPSFFDEYYLHKNRKNLETETIGRYTEVHGVKHIPVDSEEVPSESFFQDYQLLIQRIEGLADINGFNFRNLTDRGRGYAATYGFEYLNSPNCEWINNEIVDAIEKGLEKINSDNLHGIYHNWKSVIQSRESEMLRNIYEYSACHEYCNAAFTVGSAHGKSLKNKIQELQVNEALKLNWIFLDH